MCSAIWKSFLENFDFAITVFYISSQFLNGNFKVANKSRVSKFSGFKWLRPGAQTICKKE